jgi:hypothetical protein
LNDYIVFERGLGIEIEFVDIDIVESFLERKKLFLFCCRPVCRPVRLRTFPLILRRAESESESEFFDGCITPSQQIDESSERKHHELNEGSLSLYYLF